MKSSNSQRIYYLNVNNEYNLVILYSTFSPLLQNIQFSSTGIMSPILGRSFTEGFGNNSGRVPWNDVLDQMRIDECLICGARRFELRSRTNSKSTFFAQVILLSESMLSHWEFYILVALKGSGALNKTMVSITLLAKVSD